MRLKNGGWPFPHPPNMPFSINLQSPQSRGLVGWWPMLRLPGADFVKDLCVGDDMLPTNSPLWNTDGTIGWVTTHDETNFWETAASSARLDIAGPMTVSIWAMLDPARANNLTFGMFSRTNSHFQAADIQWMLMRQSFGTVFRFYGSTGVEPEVFANSPTITLGQLHHVVGRYDGTNLTCWLDGVSGAEAALASMQSLSITVTIGCAQSGNKQWYGNLADARIYDRALSGGEIRALYNPATRWELYRPVVTRFAARSPVVERIPRYGYTLYQTPGVV